MKSEILLMGLFCLVAIYLIIPSASVKQFEMDSDRNRISIDQAKIILNQDQTFIDFAGMNSDFNLEMEKIDNWDIYLHKNFDLRDDWSNLPDHTIYKVMVKHDTLTYICYLDSNAVIDSYTVIGVGQ